MYSGINVEDDDKYKGVYEWKRVDTSTSNLDAASLSFTNWVPCKTISPEMQRKNRCKHFLSILIFQVAQNDVRSLKK